MEEVARLLNGMLDAGVISDYAVFGAVAQMRYTEAVATFDADILVALPDSGALDLLGPIYAFCRAHGYEPEGEAVRVGEWPVQFIPAFSPLTVEAMREAEIAELGSTTVRVVRAVHLAVIALSVGRPKDLARVIALRDAGAVSDAAVSELARRHGLASQWQRFQDRFDEP